jgi:quercetin 2,3-dioxygenase
MSSREQSPLLWPSERRGQISTNWLDARLTFNFGPWSLAGRERFGPLRVLNDDRVLPLSGFGMHEHQDLEILMVPLTAPIEHRDSEGRHQWVRPGQIQWMRAGSGIAHSQMNASAEQTDRHLQLWVEPTRRGLAPEVHVHDIGSPVPGHWLALCGTDAALFQPDAEIRMWLGCAQPGKVLTLMSAGARLLQVVDGSVQVLGVSGWRAALSEGDALVFHNHAGPLLLRAPSHATLLCVDLPAPVL